MTKKYYFKLAPAVALFATLFVGCTSDYLDPAPVTTSNYFRIMFGKDAGRGSQHNEQVLKEMQVYSFLQDGSVNPEDNMSGNPGSFFHHKVVGLGYENTSASLQTKAMRTGLWDIAMISPQGAPFAYPIAPKKADETLMYTFDPTKNNAQAHEFYYGYHRLPKIEADKESPAANVSVARNVAKIMVVVDRGVDVDTIAKDHKIVIDNVPSKISWAGTLLKGVGGGYQTNKSDFDVLAKGTINGKFTFRAKNKTTDPGILVSDTLSFIIPAHRGVDFWEKDGSLKSEVEDTITKKLTISVDFAKASSGRFVKTVDIPSVPRCNQILLVRLKMQDVGMDITSSVESWVTQTVNGAAESGSLNVSQKEITVYDGSVTRVHFSSDQLLDSVYIMEKTVDGKIVNDIFDRISGPKAVNRYYDPSKKSGYIDIANLRKDDATADVKILLNASGVRREITVKRSISPLAKRKITTPYVGTFHRWFETGERVVTWSYQGEWTAYVDIGGAATEVLIDRSPSNAFLDKSMYGPSPSSAESNKVYGEVSGRVSGVNTIYFRVGWKSSLSAATTAPRYATITIRKGINKPTGDVIQTLYLRQGESPTYLYDRSGKASFSPYNLTAAKVNTAISVRGGYFTEYPTQCGAYFQWMDPFNVRFAYAPYEKVVGTWYSKPPIFEAYWTEKLTGMPTLIDVYETCPSGYRRANDGSTTAETNNETSEMRQTLWDDPAKLPTNTMSGYYADGFFDRREITKSANDNPNSTVGSGTQVAYRGVLFYNKTSKGSLFFPAAGQRAVDNGALLDTGKKGYYWTSTSTVSATVPNPGKPSPAYITTLPRNTAVTIRCVKE